MTSFCNKKCGAPEHLTSICFDFMRLRYNLLNSRRLILFRYDHQYANILHSIIPNVESGMFR
jgi:hypothetical protein